MDIDDAGRGAVDRAFANQAAYCRANDAPVTARIVSGVAAVLASEAAGAFLDRVRNWNGAPLAAALPLRVAGGLHALHLSGAEPSVADLYVAPAPGSRLRRARGQASPGAVGRVSANSPSGPGLRRGDAEVIAAAISMHEGALLPWLDSPPQTNEAGRSSNFVAAMLWLAAQCLPPRFDCLEIGSSAGINLMLDRYRYDLGGVTVGPEDAAMRFTPEWRGPPPPTAAIAFDPLKGCDVAPVDLRDPAQALRLTAYIWPEHSVRFERMKAAIALAAERAPDLVQADAAAFVEHELARPQAPGTTRILMHSIVWQYVPADQQARVTAAIEAAGARATPERPLAWIALEANRTVHSHELVVRHWPGDGAPRLLARAHAHGAWIEWLAPRSI